MKYVGYYTFFLLVLTAQIFVVNLYADSEKYILITSLYHEKNGARIDEYERCILRNIVHPLIEKIIVFFDVSNSDNERKLLALLERLSIKVEAIEGRPTFKLLFDYADHFYPGRKIIVANADIYFNHTLALVDTLDLTNLFVVLTRWDEKIDNQLVQFKESRSQDVWIYRSPFRSAYGPLFKLGTWQCDGLIAKCAIESGYKVVNPASDVQACHVHNSKIRNYSEPPFKDWPLGDAKKYAVAISAIEDCLS